MPMSEARRSQVIGSILLLLLFFCFLFVWVNRGALRLDWRKARNQPGTITEGMVVERPAPTEKGVVRIDPVKTGESTAAWTVSKEGATVVAPVNTPAPPAVNRPAISRQAIFAEQQRLGIPPAPAQAPAVAVTPPASKACGEAQKLKRSPRDVSFSWGE